MRAGEVEVQASPGVQADMKLRTLGIVNSLFKVNNVYRAEYGQGGCVKSTLLEAHEGKKHTETRVTYDYEKRRAYFMERDLLKDAVVTRSDIEIPACILDLTGASAPLAAPTSTASLSPCPSPTARRPSRPASNTSAKRASPPSWAPSTPISSKRSSSTASSFAA